MSHDRSAMNTEVLIRSVKTALEERVLIGYIRSAFPWFAGTSPNTLRVAIEDLSDTHDSVIALRELYLEPESLVVDVVYGSRQINTLQPELKRTVRLNSAKIKQVTSDRNIPGQATLMLFVDIEYKDVSFLDI